MAEELELTDPVVIPEKTTHKYRVITLTLSTELGATPADPGLIAILLRDNNGEPSNYQYTGQTAINMIKQLNTANLTTKSMHKRILEQLNKDGLLVGSVVGTPEPPASPLEEDNG
jgi:hypothetical protein